MRDTDRASLTTAFLAAVATRLGDRLAPDDLVELEQLTRDLLEELRAGSRPRPLEVTVLLADLRGFSTMTEFCNPAVVIDVLNRYFTSMSAIVHQHGGSIDKFMGDSVMALFGAPEQHADDLTRALTCAVHMQRAMIDINGESLSKGQPEIYAGIGINVGEVMAGSFGSELHYEYTVIGDEVNLTARIEAYSMRGQILLSEQCYQRTRDMIEVGSVNRVRVKGKEEPVNLYELKAITRPERVEVPGVEVRKSPRLKVDLPLRFHLIKNKQLTPEIHRGRLRDLGYNGMLAHLTDELPAFTEIAFTLTHHLTSDETSTLYAKVLRTRAVEGGFLTSLEFTSAGTPGHQAVKRYVDQLLWGR